MDLMRMAEAVYAEHGRPGFKRWEASLTWEQRAAITAAADQQHAALRELLPAVSEACEQAATALRDMSAAMAVAARDIASALRDAAER